MRPENFKGEGPVIEAHREAESREDLMEGVINGKQAVIESAWAAMESIVGEENLTKSFSGSQASPAIVLEKRTDEEVGEYAILGRLTITFSDRDSGHPKTEVKFVLGTGFEKEPAVTTSGISKISGYTQQQKKWYGAWLEEESTEQVTAELEEIANWDASSHGKKVYQTPAGAAEGAMNKLAPLLDSIECLVKSSKDEKLNPNLSAETEATVV